MMGMAWSGDQHGRSKGQVQGVSGSVLRVVPVEAATHGSNQDNMQVQLSDTPRQTQHAKQPNFKCVSPHPPQGAHLSGTSSVSSMSCSVTSSADVRLAAASTRRLKSPRSILPASKRGMMVVVKEQQRVIRQKTRGHHNTKLAGTPKSDMCSVQWAGRQHLIHKACAPTGSAALYDMGVCYNVHAMLVRAMPAVPTHTPAQHYPPPVRLMSVLNCSP